MAVVSFLAGLMLGIGLLLGGMADPAKVLGFLDVAGPWDPSLALVMAGAVAVARIGFILARRRGVPLPGTRVIDTRLILGSLVFGVGWGIAGLCPGPALVLLGLGVGKAVLFIAAMLAGMAGFDALARRSGAATATPRQAR